MRVKVKMIGQDTEFHREYYQNIRSSTVYARQENAPGVYGWYTINVNGEPDSPLRKDVDLIVVKGAYELYREGKTDLEVAKTMLQGKNFMRHEVVNDIVRYSPEIPVESSKAKSFIKGIVSTAEKEIGRGMER